jgi:hypothetical protein
MLEKCTVKDCRELAAEGVDIVVIKPSVEEPD